MTAERSEHPLRQRISLFLAALVTVPGLLVRFTVDRPEPVLGAVLFGLAIVGSAFLLATAAEVAQLDIARGLAIAVLAFIAVLPEYAVDMVFAWKAGKRPQAFAHFALANMTGANRLLIGVGWSLVVLLAAWRYAKQRIRRREVTLERSHGIDIAFLAVATMYSLSLPLKRTLTLVDTVVLVSIFVVYLARISRAPAEEPHLVGPAQYLGGLPDRKRRATVIGILLFAAAVILACAEHFADSLLAAGGSLGIDKFLLVQWLAPLASEAPELIVAGLFAWRLNANAGLGALVSSKVNQWTLLVGTLPIVFAISSGGFHGLPLDGIQREELFLTAAQSVFAVAMLFNRRLALNEALGLLGLFLAQFILGIFLPEHSRDEARLVIGVIYLFLAVPVFVRQRSYVRPLLRDGFLTPILELTDPSASPSASDARNTVEDASTKA